MGLIRNIFKRIKPLHVANNLVNYNKLANDQELYRKYGLKKSKASGVKHSDFKQVSSTPPWLDINPDNSREKLKEHPFFSEISDQQKESLLDWSNNGYAVLQEYLDAKIVDAINLEIDQLIDSGTVSWKYPHSRRLMNLVHENDKIANLLPIEQLKPILSMLLGKEVELFQSINFIDGSEQKAHADSIHMTTFPLGYLIGVWIALEDVGPDQGPLFIYPGSHRLDYVLTEEIDAGDNYFLLGKNAYSKYETAIEEVIQKNDFKRTEFLAKKGDVLMWHANLIHGGSKILNPKLTRKSTVLHYFAKDVIRYHEITQRPAIIP